MFENMRYVILFDMFLNTNVKTTTSFANEARTAAGTNKCKSRKISNHQELGLYMKNNF